MKSIYATGNVWTYHFRTIKSVLSVWMDSFPEDFRDPPNYPCLHTLESFAKQHIPESDLSVRVRHKIDKFRKEDIGNSGIQYCSI